MVRYHKPAKVLVVAIDHQSSLSIVCLGAANWTAKVKAGLKVNEVFQPCVGQSPIMAGAEMVSATQLNPLHYGGLHVVLRTLTP